MFDAKKTILLEKQYLYVKASMGFQLRGTSTEVVPTNSGFYRFLVSNLTFSLGNSYVDVLYDSTDLDFQAYCTDLFVESVQNTVAIAVENVQTDLDAFALRTHNDIEGFKSQSHEDLQTLDTDIGTGLGAINSNVDSFKETYQQGTGFVMQSMQGLSDSVDSVKMSVDDVKKSVDGKVTFSMDSMFSQNNIQTSFNQFCGLVWNALARTNQPYNASITDLLNIILLDYLPNFAKDKTVEDFAVGMGSSLGALNTLITAFKDANHSDLGSLAKDGTVSDFATGVGSALEAINTLLTAVGTAVTPVPTIDGSLTAFKSANHTDLSNLLTSFNSLAEELKKKLGNFVLLDGVEVVKPSGFYFSSVDDFLAVGEEKIFWGFSFYRVNCKWNANNQFLTALLNPFESGPTYSGYILPYAVSSGISDTGRHLTIGFGVSDVTAKESTLSGYNAVYVKRLS